MQNFSDTQTTMQSWHAGVDAFVLIEVAVLDECKV